MPSNHLSFVRIRVFALGYSTCLSILTFAIVLFALPTSSEGHIASLAVIAIISLLVGLAACSALLLPKTQCCGKRIVPGRSKSVYVGIEVLCTIASIPLIATAVVLEAGVAATHAGSNSHHSSGATGDPHAESMLSILLLILSCSIGLVILVYTSLITGLAVHTQQRTQRTDIWFANAASRRPSFAYPSLLRFLRPSEHDDGDDDSTSSDDIETARRSQRVRIEQLEINPTLQTLLRQLRSHERSGHTLAPDCRCGEKVAWRPNNPDEYRAVGQIYARVWTIITEREAQIRARALGGRQRAWSAPVPILRLPTESERRRSMFLVAFDAVHLSV